MKGIYFQNHNLFQFLQDHAIKPFTFASTIVIYKLPSNSIFNSNAGQDLFQLMIFNQNTVKFIACVSNVYFILLLLLLLDIISPFIAGKL